jgi:glycosyltransferase involved in cell wall biosynthesis
MRAVATSPFSIAILTLNEELNIERCLSSLQTLTDDLIVIDSGSTDNTLEISTKYGAQVIVHGFADFASQRNYAAQVAKYEWILFIDADEQPDSLLLKELALFRYEDEQTVYLLDRKTNYCGRWISHSGLRHDFIARLYNRNHYQWNGKVHESLSPIPLFAKKMHGRLLHFTYRNIDDHFQAMLNYTGIQAKELANAGKKIGFGHLWVKPMVRFVKHYFLQLGILDGFEGYLIAKMAAFAAFSKYSRAKWYMKNRK